MGAGMVVESTKRWTHVVRDVDRYGKIRYYYRRNGQPKVRLPDQVGSPEFEVAYIAVHGGGAAAAPLTVRAAATGTLLWLVQHYYASSDFMMLDPVTRSKRRPILDAICQEPLSQTDSSPLGDCPLRVFGAAHVQVLRDRKVATPEAANGRVKALRRVFAFAVENKPPLAQGNPARDVKLLKTNTSGHHTWTLAEIDAFVKVHPRGTKAHKMLCLLLLGGVRISDAARLGRQHETMGGKRLTFTAYKNRNKSPMRIDIPILPMLRDALDACPSKGLTYMETEFGRPFTIKGMGNRFRDWCDAAHLTHCSAHGLRKAGATIAAENGATAHELMSIFGWSDLRQPEKYTRAAQRGRLATSGIQHLSIAASEDDA